MHREETRDKDAGAGAGAEAESSDYVLLLSEDEKLRIQQLLSNIKTTKDVKARDIVYEFEKYFSDNTLFLPAFFAELVFFATENIEHEEITKDIIKILLDKAIEKSIKIKLSDIIYMINNFIYKNKHEKAALATTIIGYAVENKSCIIADTDEPPSLETLASVIPLINLGKVDEAIEYLTEKHPHYFQSKLFYALIIFTAQGNIAYSNGVDNLRLFIIKCLKKLTIRDEETLLAILEKHKKTVEEFTGSKPSNVSFDEIAKIAPTLFPHVIAGAVDLFRSIYNKEDTDEETEANRDKINAALEILGATLTSTTVKVPGKSVVEINSAQYNTISRKTLEYINTKNLFIDGKIKLKAKEKKVFDKFFKTMVTSVLKDPTRTEVLAAAAAPAVTFTSTRGDGEACATAGDGAHTPTRKERMKNK